MANVFELEAKLTLDTDGYKNSLNDASTATSAKAVAIGNVLADLAKKAGEFFVKAATTGIQYNAQIEKYTTVLTTALGNEAAAAAAIENIKQDAARTPYSVDGLVKANSYLISAGDSAEDARATILALTDAISATGGGNSELERMALNLQQIKATGKASAMDVRQFAQASIPIYDLLAKYTGKTVDQVKQMTVTYNDVAGALQLAASEGGRFYEANFAQSQTLAGQWSTLKDNVESGLGDAFSGLADLLRSDVLPAANDFVESLDFSSAGEQLEGLARVAGTVGIAFAGIGAVKLASDIALIGTNAEVTAKFITVATKAQELWNTAVSAAPIAGVAAIVGVAAVATVNYAKGLNASIKEQREFNGTASEAAANLRALTNERNQLKEAIDNGATEATLIDRYNTLNLLIPAAEQAYTRLAHEEDAAKVSGDRLAQSTNSASDAMEALEESTKVTTEELANIIESYNKLHDAVSKKVHSWFGLFDEAKVNVKTSVEEMMANMQSQIDFNKGYSANLQYLADVGLSSLGSAFQNMGAEGSAYADTIVAAIESAGGAASEGGQQIIAEFQAMAAGIASSQDDLSSSLTDITGTVEQAFAAAGATAEQAAEALDVSDAAGSAGAASVEAYISAISGGAGGAFSAAAAVAANAAAGFDSGTGAGPGRPTFGRLRPARLAVGSDYIPYDDYPALLHKGEMVIPSKISEDLRDFIGAGGQTPQSPAFSGDGISEVVGLLHQLISVVNRPIVLDSGQLVGGIANQMDNQLGDIDGYGRRGVSIA